MAGVRFADMRFRPAAFLDFTSLTGEEFEILIPPFEAAFQAHMTRWCLDGTPRTNRRFSVYRTCANVDWRMQIHACFDRCPTGCGFWAELIEMCQMSNMQYEMEHSKAEDGPFCAAFGVERTSKSA